MIIKIKSFREFVIYAVGLAWGYSMCKAYRRADKKIKKGKRVTSSKLIGMTWEEFYKLFEKAGEKLAESLAPIDGAKDWEALKRGVEAINASTQSDT